MTFSTYAQQKLPGGFKYPPRLLKFAAGEEVAELFPWVFIEANGQVGALAYEVRNADGRNLVPFASVEDDRKDIACFDGNDTSGDPPVLMLVLDDSGRSYSYANFEEWLKAAQEDAQRWSS